MPTYMCICIYARATLRVGMLACVNTQASWGAGAEYVLLAHIRRRVTVSVRACTLKYRVLSVLGSFSVLARTSTCTVQAWCAVQ